MKNRLYWIIFLFLSVFFLFILSIIAFLYEFYPFSNIKNTTYVLIISLILILVFSHILNNILINESIRPLNQFIQYIMKIIVNDPSMRKMDKEKERQILDLFNEQGYNAKDIEKGLNKLLESHNARKQFSANVSHELKSPLTSINGYAELIATGMTSQEDSMEFARRINKEGNRLLRLIDKTIQLSKLDNNYIKSGSLISFDISKLIEENIESFRGQLKDKKIKLSYESNEIIFYGNSNLIFDLFRNLISNAIKYCSTVDPYIIIKVEDKLDKIRIKVEDNGIGIDEEDQKRIFERFYVVDKSRGNKTGTGLGLSLVKNIVLLHKGKIYLESSLGKGSKFTIELPKLSEKDYNN